MTVTAALASALSTGAAFAGLFLVFLVDGRRAGGVLGRPVAPLVGVTKPAAPPVKGRSGT